MAQVINTNVASLFGQQALNKSASGLQTAMQRLSSGLRINSAKDDPTGMVTAAGLAITQIDAAITAVTTARATYGADMATFSSAVANLGVQSVNTAAAYSRVMDTDYAVETTNMIRNQILQQAGTAMLAQANQIPNSVLSLLR